jgi:hypothetical protein
VTSLLEKRGKAAQGKAAQGMAVPPAVDDIDYAFLASSGNNDAATLTVAALSHLTPTFRGTTTTCLGAP